MSLLERSQTHTQNGAGREHEGPAPAHLLGAPAGGLGQAVLQRKLMRRLAQRKAEALAGTPATAQDPAHPTEVADEPEAGWNFHFPCHGTTPDKADPGAHGKRGAARKRPTAHGQQMSPQDVAGEAGLAAEGDHEAPEQSPQKGKAGLGGCGHGPCAQTEAQLAQAPARDAGQPAPTGGCCSQPGSAAPQVPAQPQFQLVMQQLSSAVQPQGGAQPAGGQGDGHDLIAPRFAGDPVLEAVYDGERRLMKGDSGPAVTKIQQALIDAGFKLPKFGADGHYGSETASAVSAYKRSKGISPPDGIVGVKTMSALDAQFGGGPGPGPGPGPAAAPQLTPIVSVGPTPGSCGGMNFVIQWNLSSNAGRSGGFVIQDITFVWNTIDCAGNQVPNPDPRTSPLHYFEAWRAAPNSTNLSPVNTDTFFWPGAAPWAGPSTSGFVSIIATAQYHDNVAALPTHMVANNGATFAGGLQSSTTNPAVGGNTSAAVAHMLMFNWNCCPNPAQTVVLGHTP